jgi:hypothetical protein
LFENDKSKPTFIWMKWMDQFWQLFIGQHFGRFFTNSSCHPAHNRMKTIHYQNPKNKMSHLDQFKRKHIKIGMKFCCSCLKKTSL